jgi:hypothetical protein
MDHEKIIPKAFLEIQQRAKGKGKCEWIILTNKYTSIDVEAAKTVFTEASADPV